MTDLFAHATFGATQPGGYGVILADPPWRFELYSEKGEEKSPQKHYGTMKLADLAALPVAPLANREGCALIMWTTAPVLAWSLKLLDAWGFSYSSAGAWAKQAKGGGGKWTFGTGYRYRSAAEFWLLGTIGQPRQTSRSERNLIVAPVREHSRKPDAMHEMIERQFAGPYLELFARERRPGWTVWGNEIGKFDGA